MRRAVDTNLLVRWIARDDPAQTALADAAFATDVYVPLTVLVETAWVQKGRPYTLDRGAIADLLDGVTATQSISIDHEAGVRWAVDRYREGADFAGMVHLIGASSTDAFVTFDRRLARQAGDDAPIAIETLA